MSTSFLPSTLSPSSYLSPLSTMLASSSHISTTILTASPSLPFLSSPRFNLLPDFSSPSLNRNRRANVVSTITDGYRYRIRHHHSSMSMVPRVSSYSPPPSSSSSFSDSSCSSVSSHNGSHSSEEVYSDSEEDDDADVGSGDDEEDEIEQREDWVSSTSNLPNRWDVLGLGQAMVDFSGMVDDKFLERLVLEKGTRKIVNHEERGRVLQAMDGCSYKAAAGGSLSNSLVALARLGAHSVGGHPLNIAMAGSVGSDPLGGFFRAKLRRANVNFLSPPVKNGTTGTVIVLTTPDAHRTMLAYKGTSSSVDYDPYLASIISKTSILVVEGYLFEFPNTIKTIVRACKDAHRTGALVAITASDITCIQRHYDDFWEVIENHADIVFANSDEARAFCDFSSRETPVSAARYLSHFVPLISVTDGPRGSYIGVKGEAVYIPPSPCAPVDTCGAGDAYASGILYGVLRGMSDLKGMGSLAAKVAAVVVGQQGTRLRVQDAARLAEDFALQLDGSTVRLDVGSDQISSL